MAKYGRGLICAPISKSIAVQAGLSPMVAMNTDPHGTAFTTSIDHVSTSTGIVHMSVLKQFVRSSKKI